MTFTSPVPLGFTTMMLAPWAVARTNAIFEPFGAKTGLPSLCVSALWVMRSDGSKLRRGLPPEARLAHKSGWYDGVANDVGIVTHPQGSYILIVFTEGIDDGETANQTIAAVAEAVHGIWGPKPNPDAAATRPVR